MFRFHDVLITKHDQRRRTDGPYRVIRYVLEALHSCGVFVVHGLELLHVRVHQQKRVLELLRHVREVRLLHELPELRLSTGSLVIDEAKTIFRTSCGCRKATCRATLAPLLNPKMSTLSTFRYRKEGRDIVRGGLERDGRIAIGRAAMRLLLQRPQW